MVAKDVTAVAGSFPMIIQTVTESRCFVIDKPEDLPVGHAFTIMLTSPLNMEKVFQALQKFEHSIRSEYE